MRLAAPTAALLLLTACSAARAPAPSGNAAPEAPSTTEGAAPERAASGPRGTAGSPVAAAVHAHDAEIARCYEAALADDPQLSGTVLLRVTLGADGAVSGAEIAGGSLESPAVRRCLVDLARTWTLPVADPDGAVVELPLRFVPVPDEGQG